MPARQVLHLIIHDLTTAAEMQTYPRYSGLPVVITDSGQQATVQGLSGEAAAFGLRAGMPAWEARQRCPEGMFINANRAHALPLTKQIVDLCLKYTPLLDIVSLDEICLDVTGSLRLFGSAARIATRLIDEIDREMHLSLRVGIGPNRLIARVACGQAALRHFIEIGEDSLPGILSVLPVGSLGLLDQAGLRGLAQAGVQTLGALAEIPLPFLERRFGVLGPQLARAARGIDDTPVPSYEDQRSFAEVTGEARLLRETRDRETILLHVRAAADALAARLQREGCVGRSLCVTLRCADGTDFQRRHVLPGFANSSDAFYRPAAQMAATIETGAKMVKSVRLAAADLRGQAPPEQLSLLESSIPQRPHHPRQKQVQRASVVRQLKTLNAER
jgi:DNA polymerase-4